MKTKLHLVLQVLLIILLVINTVYSSHGQELPAIVRDWAAHAGNTDSSFKTPVVSDTLYTYVASYTINTATGADILLVKYDKDGVLIWSKTWSGPGNGRDQATGIALRGEYIYVCGFTYTSVANDYDFVTFCYKKDGTFQWTSTHNGPASGYDGAVAVAANAGGVYVAGVFNNGFTSSLDYGLIRYNSTTGVEQWSRSYDYLQLMDIPFDLNVSEDTLITVTGGSQNSIYDWDYATVNYSGAGTQVSVDRVAGSSAGFDRALAVKTDAQGTIYITGASAQSGSAYDVKTVKILSNGVVAWQVKEDGDGGDDQGEDLIVDGDKNVFVCGTMSQSGQMDIVVVMYDKLGNKIWRQTFDGSGGDDAGRKLCFDQFGNVVVTGKIKGDNGYDFYTFGLDPGTGSKIWDDRYDGAIHGEDEAFDISCDQNGYIYVTGTSQTETGYETVTLKYRSDYYTSPGQVDTPAVAYFFYPNSGQIADTSGNSAQDVDYYTLHHYPQLYFQKGKMNMVWSHIDQDTATADTLQRVDVSFLGSPNPTKAYPLEEQNEGSYLNYFLAQCPNGITNVYGNRKLMYEDVYAGIDALYSSNNAGLKLYFICGPQTDPSNIGLKFQGQDNLQIVNNWGLLIQTALGNYEFDKPQVYQLDSLGNRIALPWQLSWTMPDTAEAKFSGWGYYDLDLTLVIEIGKPESSNSYVQLHNMDWSTYIGGTYSDFAAEITRDNDDNILAIGGMDIIGKTDNLLIPVLLML